MSTLQPLDWAICIAYLLVVLGIGSWFAREQETNEEYFVGGRRMNWFPIGLSIFASVFSSLSFVGLPREGAYADYHLMLSILFIPLIVTPIACWIFIPLYHRLQSISVYEYLERRFHRSIRLVGSVLFSLYNIGWIGTMLVAVGVILQAVLGLSEVQLTWTLVGVGVFATFYTTIGGVKAVVWTDVLQTFVLGGGMLAVLLMAVARIDGGWGTVVDLGVRYDKFQMFNLNADLTSTTKTFFSACAYGGFVYMASYTVNQGSAQRYVAMPSIAAARRALLVNAALTGGICLLFFMVGSVLFAFYHQSLPADAAAGSGFPDLPKEDQLVPHFVLNELPRVGLTGLLLAGLFAAAMSSVDSGINNVTALIVYDWMRGRNVSVKASRVICSSLGILVILAALFIRQWEGPVFDKIIAIAGTFFGLLMGVFFLGVFLRRASTVAATAGMVCGVATVLYVILGTDINKQFYGFFGFAPTFIVGVIVSSLTLPPPETKTRGLVVGSLRHPWNDAE